MKVNEGNPDSVSIYSPATSFLTLVFFSSSSHIFILSFWNGAILHTLLQEQLSKPRSTLLKYFMMCWSSPTDGSLLKADKSCMLGSIRRCCELLTGCLGTTRFSRGLVEAIPLLNMQNFPTAGEPGRPGGGHSHLKLKLPSRSAPHNRRGWLPNLKAAKWCCWD